MITKKVWMTYSSESASSAGSRRSSKCDHSSSCSSSEEKVNSSSLSRTVSRVSSHVQCVIFQKRWKVNESDEAWSFFFFNHIDRGALTMLVCNRLNSAFCGWGWGTKTVPNQTLIVRVNHSHAYIKREYSELEEFRFRSVSTARCSYWYLWSRSVIYCEGALTLCRLTDSGSSLLTHTRKER